MTRHSIMCFDVVGYGKRSSMFGNVELNDNDVKKVSTSLWIYPDNNSAFSLYDC